MMKRALIIGLIAVVMGNGTQIELIERMRMILSSSFRIMGISPISSISVPFPFYSTHNFVITLLAIATPSARFSPEIRSSMP